MLLMKIVNLKIKELNREEFITCIIINNILHILCFIVKLDRIFVSANYCFLISNDIFISIF